MAMRYLWITRPRRPKEAGYPYIRVRHDGTVRELTTDEVSYLETKFLPGDGARPYIKSQYEPRNKWDSLAGFMLRRQLPKEIVIEPVPTEAEISDETNLFSQIDEEQIIEAHKKLGGIFDDDFDGR